MSDTNRAQSGDALARFEEALDRFATTCIQRAIARNDDDDAHWCGEQAAARAVVLDAYRVLLAERDKMAKALQDARELLGGDDGHMWVDEVLSALEAAARSSGTRRED